MLKNCYQTTLTEAGCDEAGRGPLAGPVVGAAVILPDSYSSSTLNDSKQLSEKKREELFPIIKKVAIAWGIGEVWPEEIDEINILNASYLAIHRAIKSMNILPEFILMDGNRFRAFEDVPYKCIIKGDGKYLNIAAASVLAKVHRDTIMKKLHNDFPHYGWNTNKGYPTKSHRLAIIEHGTSVYHRKSFQLLPLKQGELFKKGK